jgi:hypothetical protein
MITFKLRHFVFLMWAVCWNDTNEINLTTRSAGPHNANIILHIFWHLRCILYTYSSGVGCIVIFSCLVVIPTDFLFFFILLVLFGIQCICIHCIKRMHKCNSASWCNYDFVYVQ